MEELFFATFSCTGTQGDDVAIRLDNEIETAKSQRPELIEVARSAPSVSTALCWDADEHGMAYVTTIAVTCTFKKREN